MPKRIAAAEPQSLYPRKSSLREVIDYGAALLPITDANQLTSLLMTYHNTLLQELQKEASNESTH